MFAAPANGGYEDEAVADTQVLGAIVIARNGDRVDYYQDPKTYEGSVTNTTALGEADSFQLGSLLRSTYLNPSSSSYIKGMRSDLVDNSEIKVRIKAGGEGTVIFDSAIALLQGLFPPNENNKIELANETTVMAPLNGYQYVPVETVEPVNDRSLESWTGCPNFQKHISKFHSSEEFKKKEKEAQPFFKMARDYLFGIPTTLENAIFDYMNSQLTHNKTYAFRLPPSLIEQARSFADFHENGVFSDKESGGIGNIAGRTMLYSVLTALERVAFNDDPLQFMLIQTGYQPFISLFHELDAVKEHPELKAMPDFSSALAIELRRGSPPDLRDFLRFRFKNGTRSPFKTIYVYGTHSDIPLTEFIYKAKAINYLFNKQWAEVCGRSKRLTASEFMEDVSDAAKNQSILSVAVALVMLAGLMMLTKFAKMTHQRVKNSRRRVHLQGEEVSSDSNTLYSQSCLSRKEGCLEEATSRGYGSITGARRNDLSSWYGWELGNERAATEYASLHPASLGARSSTIMRF
ncbi:phosphoglycerate mutase-like protein [Dendrothele bispora CBS 962.96]|uniref:Phosphoglycerate mutase-like protein n=1 Tax=Dendrothele bispora (strain CBS 962.96) TaxID=1314807 RepID=A0A4S8MIF4_DENBC|nr:phosphoglycerate mutase-like protein [Dendrothele bispora CBS 962.96]